MGSASRGGQGRVLVGKMEREGPGTFSALGSSKEAAERAGHGKQARRRSRLVAVALMRRGGGRAAVEVVVELGKRRRGLFIGRVR